MRVQTKRSNEQWIDIFEQHRTSGLGLEAFCKEHDIVISTLYGARKRLIDAGLWGDSPTGTQPCAHLRQSQWQNQPKAIICKTGCGLQMITKPQADKMSPSP